MEQHLKRMGPRPRGNRDDIAEEIERIEYHRSTTTMSLTKEKELIRDEEKQRAKLKELQVASYSKTVKVVSPPLTLR